MCGRFALQASVKELAEALEVASVRITEERARYNIAPQQPIAAARAAEQGREPVELQWGLVLNVNKPTYDSAELIAPIMNSA